MPPYVWQAITLLIIVVVVLILLRFAFGWI